MKRPVTFQSNAHLKIAWESFGKTQLRIIRRTKGFIHRETGGAE